MCNISTDFDKGNGTMETGSHKEENKHKKEADQNSMYLVLLTVVAL